MRQPALRTPPHSSMSKTPHSPDHSDSGEGDLSTQLPANRCPFALRSVILEAASHSPDPPVNLRQRGRLLRWLAVAGIVGVPFGAVMGLTSPDPNPEVSVALAGVPAVATDDVATTEVEAASGEPNTELAVVSERRESDAATPHPPAVESMTPSPLQTPADPSPASTDSPAHGKRMGPQSLFGFFISANPNLPHGPGSPMSMFLQHHKPGSMPAGKTQPDHHHHQK